MTHPYPELQAEYESWVAHCVPNPDRVAEIDRVARGLVSDLALRNFGAVQARTKIPVPVQAVICHREYGENGRMFDRNPGQGDPLTGPTRHVPAGRPPLGAPPNDRFPVSWPYAALDAFTVCDRLDVISVPEWTMAYACFKEEYFNGGGYKARGLRTPYVVGGTNLQQAGKFTSDGHFDSVHMDEQLGTLPIMMRIVELAPQLAFGAPLVGSPPLAPVTAPPLAVGGSLTGTMWVQASLNVVLHPNPPLDVDGSFGKATRMAVRQARAQFGLPDNNGLVDAALCAKLDGALAAARPA